MDLVVFLLHNLIQLSTPISDNYPFVRMRCKLLKVQVDLGIEYEFKRGINYDIHILQNNNLHRHPLNGNDLFKFTSN